MAEDVEPIADDEELYRRVPVGMNWFDLQTRVLLPLAFDPHKTNDVTGLSVNRARFKSAADAAIGRSKQGYYIAVLRAGDLRANGIEAVPRPLPNDPGHAELPQLNSANRKATETQERERVLAKLTLRVEGPFPPRDADLAG